MLFRILVGQRFGPNGFGRFSLTVLPMRHASSVTLVGLTDNIVTFVSRADDDPEVVNICLTALGVSLSFSTVSLVAF